MAKTRSMTVNTTPHKLTRVIIKKKKSTVVKHMPRMKECTVRLERLSEETLNNYRNGLISVITKNSSFHPPSPVVSVRSLRSGSNVVNTLSIANPVKKPNCSLHAAVVKSIPIHNYKSIEQAWKRCKTVHTTNKSHIFRTNDIVIAKVKGHLPWPSMILEIYNGKRARVSFFGTEMHERFGFVNLSEVAYFENAYELVRIILERNNPKYHKAIKEIERLFNVPPQASFFNDKKKGIFAINQ